ncbi:MAG: Preprotein translocase, SecG subunit [candidate division TM6 bacterium GW2011_GWF2_30_66]|jgi:preprotein translocase subunit SecG|nr:MAG: Preprotein translocase, SecG subunit [candidate division TM6 bacterium GW2011_GWF2_30_66]
MLYGLLVAFLIIVCLLLILVILIQQGKGGIGLGSSFGGAQMLFGGSGGQDIFQKITWVLGLIFMFGSLGLFLLGSKVANYDTFLGKNKYAKKQVQMPIAPTADIAKKTPKTEAPVEQTDNTASEASKQ